MKNINICNIRNYGESKPYSIKVNGSNKVFGYEFYMPNEESRDKACEEYQKWFDSKIEQGDKAVLDELNRMCLIYKEYGRIDLLCWCAPRRCHAETIKAWLEEAL